MNELKCLFLGKCVRKEYEYFFEFDGEILKADDCFSNVDGYSFCEYQGKNFTNVSYYSNLVKEEKYETKGLIHDPFYLFFFGFLFIILFFSVLLHFGKVSID